MMRSRPPQEGRRHGLAALVMLSLAFVFVAGFTVPEIAHAADRPNILIIMADDLGYSDLGCYGGEIQTPNLDALAAGGLRLTNFYNASRCCPTRASLLTGVYPHQAGIGRMTAGAGASNEELPGYKGVLSRHTVTIAEVLKSAGYQTAMVGKWHVSPTPNYGDEKQLPWLNHQADLGDFTDPDTIPTARGFDRYYGNLWGVVDYFDPFSLMDGDQPVTTVPEGYYITDALNGRAVDYIKDMAQKPDQPFFLYLAHCAPHWPLHALPEDIAKYRDTYKAGWQAIREARYRRQVELGLFDADSAPLSARMDADIKWEDEPNSEWEAAAMATHAAMIDRLDQGLGRVFAQLKASGVYDNTLIFFLADNGASPERLERPGFDRPSETRDGRPVLYTSELKSQNILPGPETTSTGIGRAWANVANTPFRYWKKEEYQGGVATPLIVHWPAGLKVEPGSINATPGHVIDLAATCEDVAETRHPPIFNDHFLLPLEGKSLLPIFQTGTREGHEAIYFEHFGARAIRQGNWKLVSLSGKPWELYDLGQDFTETTDLAPTRPDKVAELEALWKAWANRAQVFPAPARKPGPGKNAKKKQP